MRTSLLLFMILFAAACQPNDKPQANDDTTPDEGVTRMYAASIGDSFSVFVKLPPGYDVKQKYPVAYVLDANLYFDMLAPTVYKYAEVGAMQPTIIVGIGYKDFETMDSLRDRDYSYPAAAAKDSFKVSGGADKFLSFIHTDLIPYIDKQYSTDVHNRILMGHSLGGYFTLYALQQHLTGNNNDFTAYIAASPSVHYADYYMLQQLGHLQTLNTGTKVKTYITYGGLEDSEEDEPGFKTTAEMSKALSASIGTKQAAAVVYQYDTYSAFGHMDMAIPTFTKGLQWALDGE